MESTLDHIEARKIFHSRRVNIGDRKAKRLLDLMRAMYPAAGEDDLRDMCESLGYFDGEYESCYEILNRHHVRARIRAIATIIHQSQDEGHGVSYEECWSAAKRWLLDNPGADALDFEMAMEMADA